MDRLNRMLEKMNMALSGWFGRRHHDVNMDFSSRLRSDAPNSAIIEPASPHGDAAGFGRLLFDQQMERPDDAAGV